MIQDFVLIRFLSQILLPSDNAHCQNNLIGLKVLTLNLLDQEKKSEV